MPSQGRKARERPFLFKERPVEMKFEKLYGHLKGEEPNIFSSTLREDYVPEVDMIYVRYDLGRKSWPRKLDVTFRVIGSELRFCDFRVEAHPKAHPLDHPTWWTQTRRGSLPSVLENAGIAFSSVIPRKLRSKPFLQATQADAEKLLSEKRDEVEKILLELPREIPMRRFKTAAAVLVKLRVSLEELASVLEVTNG